MRQKKANERCRQEIGKISLVEIAPIAATLLSEKEIPGLPADEELEAAVRCAFDLLECAREYREDYRV